jgi:hypothetical protein
MKLGEMLNKSAFYGEPAPQCDAGINQIKVLAQFILPQKFLHLFNQRLLGIIHWVWALNFNRILRCCDGQGASETRARRRASTATEIGRRR